VTLRPESNPVDPPSDHVKFRFMLDGVAPVPA
jgi:hypothetical protein